MILKKIKAADNCVMFFPERKDSRRTPRLVYDSTRLRFAEEWIQVSLSLITMEERFEGENAVDLGNGLRCEVVAKITTHIKKENIAAALVKMHEILHFTTTTKENSIYSEIEIRQRLLPQFISAIWHVIGKADYMRLLTDSTHCGELSKEFTTTSNEFLTKCGFDLIAAEISFRPVNPGIVGEHKAIVEKWMEIEKAKMELEAEKDNILEGIQSAKAIEDAKRTAELQQAIREQELLEAKSETEYIQELAKLEIDKEQINNTKKRTIEEAQRELEDFFNEGLEAKDRYQHIRDVDLINKKNEKRLLEEEGEKKAESAALEHKLSLQDKTLEQLSKEIEIEQHNSSISGIKRQRDYENEIKKAEARTKTEEAINFLKIRESENQKAILNELIEKLPHILSNIQADKSEKTIVQFGESLSNENMRNPYAMLLVALFPSLKELISSLSNQFVNKTEKDGGPSVEPSPISDDEFIDITNEITDEQ